MRSRRPWLTVPALLLACSALAAPAARPAHPAAASAHKAASAAKALPDSVLAIVGGVPLTRADLRVSARRLGADPDTLTPASAREFLDVLIDQRVLTARVAREPRAWTLRDSASYSELRDHLTLTAALDSALAVERAARVARGDTSLGRMEMGIASRDSAVRRLRPRYDEALLKRVAAAFDSMPQPDSKMSMMEQLRVKGMSPKVAPADTLGVLAASNAGDYTVRDLIRDWKVLNPLYRPPVSTVEQVRDLVHNGLYEEVLRREAARQHLETRPDIAEQLREKAEFMGLETFVTRTIYEPIPHDSVTLQKHYAAHPRWWDIPEHAKVLRLAFASRAEGEQFIVQMARPHAVDSLLAEALREKVDYSANISAADDSVLERRCRHAGAGAFIGPDSTAHAWRVIRVQEIVPARARTFDQARDLVAKDWNDRQGEVRMRALLDDLRKKAHVVKNTQVLAHLTLSAGRD